MAPPTSRQKEPSRLKGGKTLGFLFNIEIIDTCIGCLAVVPVFFPLLMLKHCPLGDMQSDAAVPNGYAAVAGGFGSLPAVAITWSCHCRLLGPSEDTWVWTAVVDFLTLSWVFLPDVVYGGVGLTAGICDIRLDHNLSRIVAKLGLVPPNLLRLRCISVWLIWGRGGCWRRFCLCGCAYSLSRLAALRISLLATR
ncbi:hypothetical protein Nepgr_006817 [Nepenthes gracilis]|uniref:Uncharacterized protein n=1 Tax=Nepenthes gracilis TaxID=150966 RepID=A0AAD3XHP2_NEPGR|nr:hypothetical protein Nepgr_006817 [Nepenthes gracilis]